jgi:acyl-CoA synthetase (AMP-forming)/AMP-acid ligase II
MTWTLANIARVHGAAQGDRPMIAYRDRIISYADMDQSSSRVAQGLTAAAVGPQDRVAFLDKNGPEYFEVLFGCAKVNAVNVAVNWRLAPTEMAYTINDAEAKVLFAGEEFRPHLDEIEGQLHSVKAIVVIGAHERHPSYRRWLGNFPARDPGIDSAPSDVAMQLYTSGTTGLPKGAMLTNRNLGNLLPHVSGPWGFDATSVNAVALPLYHIGGSGWALCGMWNGCHSILFREFSPPERARASRRSSCRGVARPRSRTRSSRSRASVWPTTSVRPRSISRSPCRETRRGSSSSASSESRTGRGTSAGFTDVRGEVRRRRPQHRGGHRPRRHGHGSGNRAAGRMARLSGSGMARRPTIS